MKGVLSCVTPRHRGLFRGRLLVAGHLQHSLHRTGRDAAQYLPEPGSWRDGGDAAVRGETGDQTGQESRSASHRAAASLTALRRDLPGASSRGRCGRACTPATSWTGGGPGTPALWRAWRGPRPLIRGMRRSRGCALRGPSLSRSWPRPGGRRSWTYCTQGGSPTWTVRRPHRS